MTHLGGHANITHVDFGVFDYVKEKYSIQTMLDIGCGPADMVKYAIKNGVTSIGVDGDPSLQPNDLIVQHDFYQGPFKHTSVDLIWSVEFLEHVDAKYLDNVFATFKQASMVICTHALPHELGGHNHVNCQNEDYWIQKFSENGFSFDEGETQRVRAVSSMRRNFMRNTGKVFIRQS